VTAHVTAARLGFQQLSAYKLCPPMALCFGALNIEPDKATDRELLLLCFQRVSSLFH